MSELCDRPRVGVGPVVFGVRMAGGLAVSIGQHSDRGAKETNQDFHGALVPGEPERALKGIAVAIADGISTSRVSGIAAETAVRNFLDDYYCTSEAWTVKTAGQRVIAAINSWLYGQTRQSGVADERDNGYVATFSAVVFKAASAHIFHIGDTRICRLEGRSLEQLTIDHRVSVSPGQSYLARALGINPGIEIDYRAERLSKGDIYVLCSDGVYEYADGGVVADAVADCGGDLDAACRRVVARALAKGSPDNLTIQIVRIDAVADGEAADFTDAGGGLPAPPLLDARMEFDGYLILRTLHSSSRSHVYLARDIETGALAALKIPSMDMRDDEAYLRRFMMEDWIARRVNSAHVLKAYVPSRRPNYLYTVTEFVEGQSLTQWMADNPSPPLDKVRDIAGQIAMGLRAFHRMEMVHQDLRPENILIDGSGTVKIIDFGSTRVSGVVEANPVDEGEDILGTLQYTAPEYFYGETAFERSDMFSLGVIVYQMLTGQLPFGATVSRIRSRGQAAKLAYVPARYRNPAVPDWVDGALRKALQPDPMRRYEAISEFVHDLGHPNPDLVSGRAMPLAERSPLAFWQTVSLLLAFAVVSMAGYIFTRP